MTEPTHVDPFRPDDGEDARDRELVEAARGGSSQALEELVRRHQGFLHNLALRVLYFPQDAEDAAQEILVKAVTKLSSFEGRSRFRTWLYRIATNHLLNVNRTLKEGRLTFTSFGKGLDELPDEELPDRGQVPVDVKLLVEEAKLGCTMAMLLCLDREQRLVYALGEIMGASDALAAEVLEIGRDAFRQKLSRARKDLHAFMNEKCGLVDPANRCRCEKKTRALMRAGYVDPKNLRFAGEHLRQVREVAVRSNPALPGYDGICAEIYREQPFQEPRDVAARVRRVVESAGFRETFRV
jgi:RNA polymerase sigma factor (sigma-70 family)